MKKRTKGHKRKHLRKKHWELEYPPEVVEEKWKDNFWKVKSFDMHLTTDIDRDGVIDAKDCQPFNPDRQDAPTRPDINRPSPVVQRVLTPEMSATRQEHVEGPVRITKHDLSNLRINAKLPITSHQISERGLPTKPIARPPPISPTPRQPIEPISKPLPPHHSSPEGWSLHQTPGYVYTAVMPPKGFVWIYNTSSGERKAQPISKSLPPQRIPRPVMPIQNPVFQTENLPRGTYVQWQYPAMKKGSSAFDIVYQKTVAELEAGKASGKYDVNAQVGITGSGGYTYFSIRTPVGYPA